LPDDAAAAACGVARLGFYGIREDEPAQTGQLRAIFAPADPDPRPVSG
jgi:hypothetical protein